MFTKPRYFSYSRDVRIQSVPSDPVIYTLILPSPLRPFIPDCLFASGFLAKTLCTFLFSSVLSHAPSISYFEFDLPYDISVRITDDPFYAFFSSDFLLLRPRYLIHQAYFVLVPA